MGHGWRRYVLGVMHTVGKLNLPLNIVALVPSCENLPDGLAVKPGMS